jgi:hypothetical protein
MSKKSIAYPKNAVFQLLGRDSLIGKDVTLLNNRKVAARGEVDDANLRLNHADSTVTLTISGSEFDKIKFNNEDEKIKNKMTHWENYKKKVTKGGKSRRIKNKQKSNSKTRRSRR